MPEYEVKAWIKVTAADERDALAKAADLLDSLPDNYRDQTEIEGEGAVYQTDADA